MIKRMDYEDFKDKMGDWAPMFRNFIESEDMFDIYHKLKMDSMKERITPSSDNVYRAFSTMKPENLKVVWYLMDPYPRRYKGGALQATGIAMDCSNSPDGNLQPSLNHFYNAIDKEMGIVCQRSPSLEYLQEQGVMMLNTDLTCKLNKTASHAKLWEPFQKYFLEEVLRSSTGIIYVLSGEHSERMEKYINPVGNYIFKTHHPAYAEHKHTDWDSKGVFKQINKILEDHKKERIYWDRSTWEMLKDLPF